MNRARGYIKTAFSKDSLTLKTQLGKPLWKSITMYGIALILAGLFGLDEACGSKVQSWAGDARLDSLLPDFVCRDGFSEKVGMVLAFFGIRRK
jgi:hypothetical protein